MAPVQVCAHPDGCKSPVAVNGFFCANHWRFTSLEERARLLAGHAATELPEPASTCMVPACAIPDTAADNVPVGDGFLCRGHWRRVSTNERHGLTVAKPSPEAISRALAEIAFSERRLAGRHPARPVAS
jgi:hypothetical protein